jgi:uncharacterized protein (TIGR00266 family)
MQYKIEGTPLPVVICNLDAGEQMITERGSMSWMSPNMKMETTSNGGIGKAFGRMFAGEALFQNRYTAMGGPGMIAFASSFPGAILPVELHGDSIIVQKSAFLAMEKGMDLSLYFQKKLGKGLFGGEGFIMQKITGNGTVFLEIDGSCKEYQLGAGQSIVVDTGYLAAMSDTCSMDIVPVQGGRNVLFGGEGLFHTVVTGPGKVWLQTMPLCQTAQALAPFLPSSGEGINIKLGDD